MNNDNYKIELKDLPLWIDPDDIFRIYLKCLNFVKNDLFEIVHEKDKIPQNISDYKLITEGINPKLSCKSNYGVCLHRLEKKDSNNKILERRLISSPNLDFKSIGYKLKIIKSKHEWGSFCLVPSVEMYLFEYKEFIHFFVKNFSHPG